MLVLFSSEIKELYQQGASLKIEQLEQSYNARVCRYNGTPRGMLNCNEGGCRSCNQPKVEGSEDKCVCLHAEENALLEAGRERVGTDAVLYCTT